MIWLPCAIGGAIKNFTPYIVQSSHTTQYLTDSRHCVQAYEKIKRGAPESQPSCQLSVVHVRHISGVKNLPSDFATYNPRQCLDPSCQICKCIAEIEDPVVQSISATDVCAHALHQSNKIAGQVTQQECSDLRRTHSHLSQGTRPSKKATKISDVS